MLVRDPNQRATAEELLKDEFIIRNVEKAEIADEVLLDIGMNLKEFRKHTVFQAGVMTFIVRQNENLT